MQPDKFTAFGFDVTIFALDGSLTWNLFHGTKMLRHGFVRGTSKRAKELARYRAREAAKLVTEG